MNSIPEQPPAVAPYRYTAPTVTIADEGGHLAVYIDRHDGRGPYLSATYPTGIGAQYQEARDRNRAEADHLAAARKADLLRGWS